MRQRLFMPSEVKEAIAGHIHAATAKAVDGYESAQEDEDSVTGDMGATLRVKQQKVVVQDSELPGVWTWSLNYHKFRGRGKKATESVLGADAIFELEIRWNDQNIQKKCSLFQAKNQWQGRDKTLLEQCIKLSTWREAAFVVNYTPTKYEAFLIDEVVAASGSRSKIKESRSLPDFLRQYFLECLVGDTELEYYPKTRSISWRTVIGERVFTKFSVGHRFAIKVSPPKRPLSTGTQGREVLNDDVHGHRMGVEPRELLSVNSDFTPTEIKRGRRKVAQIYHTDLNADLEDLYQDILKKRMQEFNNAFDVLNSELKSRS